MAFVGKAWRSGTATDPAVNTGTAPTTTVTALNPATASRTAGPIAMTVTGTNFDAGTKIYANYNPVSTTFVNATTLTTTSFNPMPDNGQAGNIVVGVVRPGQRISTTTRNFAAT